MQYTLREAVGWTDETDSFEKRMDMSMGIVGMIIFIHVLFLIVMTVIACSTELVDGKSVGMVGLWLFLNAAFSVFSAIFAAACFSGRRLWSKIVFYPFGVLILFMALCGLAFPAAFIGIVVAACAGGS